MLLHVRVERCTFGDGKFSQVDLLTKVVGFLASQVYFLIDVQNEAAI
jgi:hypothetical protein